MGTCSDEARLIAAMQAEFGDDQRRITHALRVLGYAKEIMQAEGADPQVVIAAAVLHDIGIQEAERKHGSAIGKYQELEGPPIARRIMTALGLDAETMEHVCRIVGSHHSAGVIDTPEFRAVWDADWLVNIPEEFPDKTPDQLAALIANVFKTTTGKQLAARDILGKAEEYR